MKQLHARLNAEADDAAKTAARHRRGRDNARHIVQREVAVQAFIAEAGSQNDRGGGSAAQPRDGGGVQHERSAQAGDDVSIGGGLGAEDADGGAAPRSGVAGVAVAFDHGAGVDVDDNAALLGGSRELVLNNVRYLGRTITVVLTLPATIGTRGALTVVSRQLNGVDVVGDTIDAAALTETNRIDVVLGTAAGVQRTVTLVDDADYQRVFGPRTPSIEGVDVVGNRVQLRLSRNGENAGDVSFRVYRDGVVVADALPGSTTTFTDPTHDASSARTPCYVLESTFSRTATHSQHSSAQCFWGPGFQRITTVSAAAMSHVGGSLSNDHGFAHYEPWGDDGDRLDVEVVATQSGPHLLQLTFGNGAGSIDSGITCGVKRIVVSDVDGGVVVGDGIVVMPHLGTWQRWEDSSFVRADLVANHRYRVVVVGDDDTVNMSSFQHFAAYTGSQVGTDAFNRVNIAELKLLAR